MPARSIVLTRLRIVFGVCLIALVIFFADGRAIYQHLTNLYPLWLVIAGLCICISSLLGAFNLYMLLPGTRPPWSAFLPIYWSGWSLNLIMPGQIGDIAGIAALLRRHDMDWHTSIGKSLVDKFNSLMVTIIFGLAGIHAIDYFPGVSQMEALLAALASFIALGILIRYAKHAKRMTFLTRTREFISNTGCVIFHTLRYNPARTLLNLGLTFIKLGLTGISYWCLFEAQNIVDLDILSVIFLASASSLIAYIPISFSGIGTVEIAGVYLFQGLGIGTAAIVTTYLVLRCIVMLIAWLPTGIWWLFTQPAKQPFR